LGIGSQRSALDSLGLAHEVVGISEIGKYAIAAYEAIHGKTKNYGDIMKIERLPYADLWTYSFPCTDISLAGKQQVYAATVSCTSKQVIA
jgi:DNA (cytosine-5)-methyltransferase 1